MMFRSIMISSMIGYSLAVALGVWVFKVELTWATSLLGLLILAGYLLSLWKPCGRSESV